MGHRGCSRLGSGSWPICQDRMWGRTGDTMWGSEKGTAGTGTSRRHKWAHRTAPTPQVPCAPPALRVLLHLPGPGGPCLQRPVRGRPGREGAGWAGQVSGGSGVRSAHTGVAAPAAAAKLRARLAPSCWVAGASRAARSPGRAGTPRHYPTAAAGAARAGRGRQGRHGQVGRGTVRSHRPPAPGPRLLRGGQAGGDRAPLPAWDPAGAPPSPIRAPDAWGRQPGSGPAAALDVPCGSAAHNDPIEVPQGGGGGHPRWWWQK